MVMRPLPDESLVKRAMKEDFKDKRPKGRSPKRWSNQIREDTKIPLPTVEKYAKDRGKWR